VEVWLDIQFATDETRREKNKKNRKRKKGKGHVMSEARHLKSGVQIDTTEYWYMHDK